MTMLLYSLALTLGLTLASPWWVTRMITTQRYREGLRQRLGFVPAALRHAAAGKKIIWLHAVSVGEVLAATRLVTELETALGDDWLIVISTTTRTGQALARDRFKTQPTEGAGAFRPLNPTPGPNRALAPAPATTDRVFYMPLDFAFAVRGYLRALQPQALILMESELWPRLLHECSSRNIPVIVANARVSDRSFTRTLRFRKLWQHMARHVTLFLAQSDLDAERLKALGSYKNTVRTTGNLKYDIRSAEATPIAKRIGDLRGASRLVVAGSTLEGEEELLLSAWPRVLRGAPDIVLVLAPRHPERFARVRELCLTHGYEVVLGSQMMSFDRELAAGVIVLLNTIGDLATVYSKAHAAFIGGSLVPAGGHNPLEAARFGVPTMMGPSYENFRGIVNGMREANAIAITKPNELAWRIIELTRYGQSFGQRAKEFAESQMGATQRTVEAILSLLQPPSGPRALDPKPSPATAAERPQP